MERGYIAEHKKLNIADGFKTRDELRGEAKELGFVFHLQTWQHLIRQHNKRWLDKLESKYIVSTRNGYLLTDDDKLIRKSRYPLMKQGITLINDSREVFKELDRRKTLNMFELDDDFEEIDELQIIENNMYEALETAFENIEAMERLDNDE